MSGNLKNILFHDLKGIDGWSFLAVNKIDVGRVLDLDVEKRSFCLFNRDHPYTLCIDYKKRENRQILNPVFVGGKMGFTMQNYTTETCFITKRFKSF
jgi:hypothetical protein